MSWITHIIAIIIGVSAGYWWARVSEQSRLREWVINAYKRGKSAGYEKAVKEGKR